MQNDMFVKFLRKNEDLKFSRNNVWNQLIQFCNPIYDEDCDDVDECNETDPALIHNCHADATCTNTG